MATSTQANSTLKRKVDLRRRALAALPADPVVLETHGGRGQVYLRCYTHLTTGCVLEKNAGYADALAEQRPTWRVYRGDAPTLLAGGIAADLPVTLFDLDPWGQPWRTLAAFLAGRTDWPADLTLVANDGTRTVYRQGSHVSELVPAEIEFGRDHLYPRYLEVCQWMVRQLTAPLGYQLAGWEAYHCGKEGHLTHWWARLHREIHPQPPPEPPPATAP